jgi:hypothetical protein
MTNGFALLGYVMFALCVVFIDLPKLVRFSPKSARDIECIYTRDLTRERLRQTTEYLLNYN